MNANDLEKQIADLKEERDTLYKSIEALKNDNFNDSFQKQMILGFLKRSSRQKLVLEAQRKALEWATTRLDIKLLESQGFSETDSTPIENALLIDQSDVDNLRKEQEIDWTSLVKIWDMIEASALVSIPDMDKIHGENTGKSGAEVLVEKLITFAKSLKEDDKSVQIWLRRALHLKDNQEYQALTYSTLWHAHEIGDRIRFLENLVENIWENVDTTIIDNNTIAMMNKYRFLKNHITD